MDSLKISLFLILALSSFHSGDCRTLPKYNVPKDRVVNPNRKKSCFCFANPGDFSKVPEILKPNSGLDGLERVVIYLYKDKETNDIKMYLPNDEKQVLIPDLAFEVGDKLLPVRDKRFNDIFVKSDGFGVNHDPLDINGLPLEHSLLPHGTDHGSYEIPPVNSGGIQSLPHSIQHSPHQSIHHWSPPSKHHWSPPSKHHWSPLSKHYWSPPSKHHWSPSANDSPSHSKPHSTSHLNPHVVPDKTLNNQPGRLPPDQPGNLLPDNPGITLPEQPGTWRPDQPGRLPPDQPGKLLPDEQGKSLTDQPDKLVPDQPGKLLPDEQSELRPDQPGKLLPDEQSELLPDQPGKLLPDEQSELLTDQPGKLLPDEQSELLPDQPGGLLPDNSSTWPPEQPGTWLIDQSGELLPDKSDTWLPDQSGGLLPDHPGTWLPETPGTWLPEEQGRLPPDQPGKLLPDQQDKMLPDKPVGLQTDQQDKFLPDKPGGLLPDEQSRLLLDEQGDLLPDKQGGLLPDEQGNLLPDKPGGLLLDEQGRLLPDQPHQRSDINKVPTPGSTTKPSQPSTEFVPKIEDIKPETNENNELETQIIWEIPDEEEVIRVSDETPEEKPTAHDSNNPYDSKSESYHPIEGVESGEDPESSSENDPSKSGRSGGEPSVEQPSSENKLIDNTFDEDYNRAALDDIFDKQLSTISETNQNSYPKVLDEPILTDLPDSTGKTDASDIIQFPDQVISNKKRIPNKENKPNEESFSIEDIVRPVNNQNNYETFDRWFIRQMLRFKVYKEHDRAVNISAIEQYMLKILQDNDMLVTSEGVLTDRFGTALDVNNLHLRPILIGKSMAIKNILDDKQQELILPVDLPYLQAILVTNASPPIILGIIPIGKTIIPPSTINVFSTVLKKTFAPVQKTGIITDGETNIGINYIQRLVKDDNPMRTHLSGSTLVGPESTLNKNNGGGRNTVFTVVKDTPLIVHGHPSHKHSGTVKVYDSKSNEILIEGNAIDVVKKLFNTFRPDDNDEITKNVVVDENDDKNAVNDDDIAGRIVGGSAATGSGTPLSVKGRMKDF